MHKWTLTILATASVALAADPVPGQPGRPAADGAAAAQEDKAPTATPAEKLKVHKDFKVELLYSVPKNTEGSWVNLCVDPKGRLIASDQYGPLYRITPPPPGGKAAETKVEKLELPLGGAHGLLWAFDSLYVMINENVRFDGVQPGHGLYRARSHDGGDTFEKPELLREMQAGGEHGAHAILPSPDGKSLYIVCGNQSKMISPLAGSRVPRLWGEDHLLPRVPDGNGFMRGVLGPGGCIYKTDPDGKNWELFSTGYRNEFDAAFNRHGDLFTYDADMEWDMNMPWYRPTRVCLATSGSEFGWRNGAGKWPPYYPDSLPAVYNVGPGSPTGVCFGCGAKFPARYQEAFFMCDWSYGKLYALHLTPDGGAYKAEAEEFLQGAPLPLTDVVVNPRDGALYFTIGGRRTLGWPDRAARAQLIQRFDPLFPAKGREMNAELGQLLVYRESPGIAAKMLQLMAEAPTQEEQLEYLRSLRVLETGWTPARRREYFAWYPRAANYKGGASLRGFLRLMKADAVATLTAKEKEELKPILEAAAAAPAPIVGKPRPLVKQYKLDELVPVVEKGLTKRDFDRGRKLFGEANCFSCHRFDNEGGAQAPDLTGVSARYSIRDLLEKVLDPNKANSDPYAATVFALTDGTVVTGRIVNYQGDNMSVMTNMLDPNGLKRVDVKKVESMAPSKTSMMPTGLLDTFKEDEILDLVAYLLSRGDRSNGMFRK